MDFIERWFGISPDGGSGTTEMLYLVVIAIVVAMIIGWRVAPRAKRRLSRLDR